MVQQCHHLQVYTGIVGKYENHYGAAEESKVAVTYRLIKPLEEVPSLGQQNNTLINEYPLKLSTKWTKALSYQH